MSPEPPEAQADSASDPSQRGPRTDAGEPWVESDGAAAAGERARDEDDEEDGASMATPARPGLGKAEPTPFDSEQLEQILESLIFVSDAPISAQQLANATRTPVADLRAPLDHLLERYAGRGVELQRVAGGYQFRTPEQTASFVRAFLAPKPVRLSRAQLEVLAIVAYRQPITRPEIDDVRGVDSGSALRLLADRELVKTLGRKDDPGRPLLYGTTRAFLELFGLASLRDLPTLKEFSELSEESRQIFERRMGEPIDLAAVERDVAEAEALAEAEAEARAAAEARAIAAAEDDAEAAEVEAAQRADEGDDAGDDAGNTPPEDERP